MWSYRIKGDRELYALVTRAQEISTRPIQHWALREFTVMELANEHAKDFGYVDWKDAFTQLRRRYG